MLSISLKLVWKRKAQWRPISYKITHFWYQQKSQQCFFFFRWLTTRWADKIRQRTAHSKWRKADRFFFKQHTNPVNQINHTTHTHKKKKIKAFHSHWNSHFATWLEYAGNGSSSLQAAHSTASYAELQAHGHCHCGKRDPLSTSLVDHVVHLLQKTLVVPPAVSPWKYKKQLCLDSGGAALLVDETDQHNTVFCFVLFFIVWHVYEWTSMNAGQSFFCITECVCVCVLPFTCS